MVKVLVANVDKTYKYCCKILSCSSGVLSYQCLKLKTKRTYCKVLIIFSACSQSLIILLIEKRRLEGFSHQYKYSSLDRSSENNNIGHLNKFQERHNYKSLRHLCSVAMYRLGGHACAV